ncbi:tannase/feruloyl esterase family alpha/beta hydrolase [Sphingomonas sp. HF-S3]|uniref:Tannase/feruloyl esterase family alpha/beta hydrolase n=1 Tax=Sphingomonas rustica TaxID=3103142 RepID=A0ABV0BF27_9SPHN
MAKHLFGPSLTALMLASGCATPAPESAPPGGAAGVPVATGDCAALGAAGIGWPDPTMRILSAKPVAAGATIDTGQGGKSPPLPAHCEVDGILAERTGQDGQSYAIRFKMRLPADWNRRFLFQGGGGTNGEIGNAVGMVTPGAPPALAQGFAVISQDSGHSNPIFADPAKGGAVAFGFDAQARADYGHASLKRSYDAARAILTRFYGGDPAHSYFVGCSKGGQEGMAFAQRYPEAFDGIVAAAPGFSLPKAAVQEAWDTRTFAAVVRPAGGAPMSFERLADSFSDADLGLARDAVLAACDVDDGLKDGIVGAFAQCTTARVRPQFEARQCKAGKTADCLSAAQIGALETSFAGARTSRGEPLYASFPWDSGMADPGWRIWKIGFPAQGGRPAAPAINVAMGAASLATIFSTPPRLLPPGPQGGFDYQLGYDFDRDAKAIFATGPGFPRSAWDDIGMRSPDLRRFQAHGGKMIVPQGVSDPVFSINDTLAWWGEVDARSGGRASSFVRVFPVPGMGHCAGGPATDQFNALDALVRWVEQGQAPDRIVATAGPASPWPGRTRPLCPYPLVARPAAPGEALEKAEGFVCRR